MYEDYADAIYRHCYFRVFDKELAKDLVQETFAKTWRYLASGREVLNGQAFLYKVATNLMINRSRKKKEISLDMLQEQGFDPGTDQRASLENFIAGKKVFEELDRLDDRYSQVITMRFVDDLSPQEIADILGESENAVSVRLHRALKKLKELLAFPHHE